MLLPVPYAAQVVEGACGAAALEMVCRHFGISSLPQLSYFDEVKVEPEIAERARLPIDRMVSIG